MIDLKEWETKIFPGLYIDGKSKETAELLTKKGIIEIIELKDGLQITANSYVGRLVLGNIQINVTPKIQGMPLYTLLKYAYGLSGLNLFGNAAHSISKSTFFDLLIYELYSEAEELLRRGVHRAYVPKDEDLSSPRGRIITERLALSGGGSLTATLPCWYFDRNENNILNSVLLSGLLLAISLTDDYELKNSIRRIVKIFSETIDGIELNRVSLHKAKTSLNRLTNRYTAALEIINILYETQAIQLEDSGKTVNLRGYYFDMNLFFERLIGKLLTDFTVGYTVKTQYSLNSMFSYNPNFNPRRKSSPTPRPDFMLTQNGRPIKIFDAKYRDLWENTLPREMLYQLSVYALSGVGGNTATILYPVLNDYSTVQKIDIFDSYRNSNIAKVILQPVNLCKVAEMIDDSRRGMTEYINNKL